MKTLIVLLLVVGLLFVSSANTAAPIKQKIIVTQGDNWILIDGMQMFTYDGEYGLIRATGEITIFSATQIVIISDAPVPLSAPQILRRRK